MCTLRRKSHQKRIKVKSIDADIELFGRLVVISKDRKIDLEKYELLYVPLALANDDGSLTKTNKAQTLRDLESFAPSIQTVDSFVDATERDLQRTTIFINYGRSPDCKRWDKNIWPACE